MQIKGIPVSQGYAHGPVYLYNPFDCDVKETVFEKGDESKHLVAFAAAKQEAEHELNSVIEKLEKDDPDKAKIFVAHKDILFDEEVEEMVTSAITHERFTAVFAVAKVFGELATIIGASGDPLIAARAADIHDVQSRLIRILHGGEEKNLSFLTEPVVVVARDLMPSDTATMDRDKVLGIITEEGSPTSHTAILARGFGIPAVVGARGIVDAVSDGMAVVLDAVEGYAEILPTREQIEKSIANSALFGNKKKDTEKYYAAKAITSDGVNVAIGLNVGSDERDAGYEVCDFVGLLRSEFIYMNSDHMPTEQEQFIAYKRVLQHAGGKPVTLRTIDIGGDKKLPYLSLPQEENPFLGIRALRLCFKHPGLLETQLHAALRASTFGQLQIMLPMVGSVDDIRKARQIFETVKADLIREGEEFGDKVKFGIMIEIPSIAMAADLAAKEVDFASVGTNDLCQYMCAADRMNPELGAYGQAFSPAMLRVLSHIVKSFDAAGKPISVCGEFAGEPLGALALVGLGYRKLSMSGSSFAAVKRVISGVSSEHVARTVQQAMSLSTEENVLELLKKLV